MAFAKALMGVFIGHIMMVVWFRLLSASLDRALEDPRRAATRIIATYIARALLMATIASAAIYALGLPGGLGMCLSVTAFRTRLIVRGLGAL